jgi:seryl-tRNA synthetase
VIKQWGEPKKFPFNIKDHVQIGENLELIDLERGAKIAQSGFYFLKNEGALLEFALINFVVGKLVKKGFIPVVTPQLVKEKIIVGCGFQARSEKERQIYHVEGEDLDLIATAEITLVGQHTGEIIDIKRLPIKYAGFSSCFRVEKGSYGKDVKGILRVHEFEKIEMVAFCKPEDAKKIHDEFLAIEEEIFQELEIPYQVLLICTGDLGSAAAKKYDVEAWIPSQQRYREVTSTSNTTDFQARRLEIKYKDGKKTDVLHTLNGTACAIGRTIIAILENYQQEDGSVTVPEVLKPYIGKDKIQKK